jgi:mycoredoxin
MHSRSVERFLRKNDIATKIVNIDGDPEARERVKTLNGGYASVPTLLFPDGTKLTEPSFNQLRAKFNIEQPTLSERLKGALGK